MEKIPNQRAIFDRKKIVARIAELAEDHNPDSFEFRGALLPLLKTALSDGQSEIKRRFM